MADGNAGVATKVRSAMGDPKMVTAGELRTPQVPKCSFCHQAVVEVPVEKLGLL